MAILKIWDGSQYVEVTGSTGDTIGPSSSTDNAIARYSGTTGKLLQDSAITIDDSGNLTTTGDIVGYAPKESHVTLLALAAEHAFS